MRVPVCARGWRLSFLFVLEDSIRIAAKLEVWVVLLLLLTYAEGLAAFYFCLSDTGIRKMCVRRLTLSPALAAAHSFFNQMNAPNELASIHEAAHCVIRNYFSHPVAELWINGERGNCKFRVPDDRGDIVHFEDIAASLAGKIAEDRLCGFKDEAKYHSSGDYKRAFDCALRLNSGDEVGANLLLQWMSRRVELFVAKLWPSIEKVSYALLNEGKLNREQIAAILNGDNVA